jgi:polyphosphate kinase 2
MGRDHPKDRSHEKPAKMKTSDYEEKLEALQVELCYLQDWVRATGARVIVVLEGRDTAGKGGLIKAIAERVSPRTFRVIALSAPDERQKTQLYLQRYIGHFRRPARSRSSTAAGTTAPASTCHGLRSKKEYQSFLENCPKFEGGLVDTGITLIKIWLEVGKEEQDKRFMARVTDPLRQWKLSPMDLLSYSRWYDYGRARDRMFAATDSEKSPWYIVFSDDKKRARLNAISHILSLIPYKKIKHAKVKLPKRSDENKYDDRLKVETLNLVPERY